ncbi:hypothetical protein C8R45DRAFT_371980 [Mycena sanguinolenta]|nr:hypothetical protein C8R45DRAFT_371980 [Mycena sanguinolenta]
MAARNRVLGTRSCGETCHGSCRPEYGLVDSRGASTPTANGIATYRAPQDQPPPPKPAEQTPAHTPIHRQFVTRPHSRLDEYRWEILMQHTPLPPGVGAPVPSPPKEKESKKPAGFIWGRGGSDKDKDKDLPPLPPPEQTPAHTPPIHHQVATTTRPQSQPDDDRWEVLDTPPLPPGAGPLVPSPTGTGARSPSPYSIAPATTTITARQPGQPTTLKKKNRPVIGILNAFEPGHARNRSEERFDTPPPPKEKEAKKPGVFIWGRGASDKDKDKEREREREREQRERIERAELEREAREAHRGRERRDDDNELTRKIGFLTATASEDWTLILDVCDHASASEANANEAARALRREFKYGEPAAQLTAARVRVFSRSVPLPSSLSDDVGALLCLY